MSYIGYKLVIEKRAQKFIEKVNTQEYEKLVLKIKELVVENGNNLNIKKLKGFTDLYRLKVDNYRVIFAPIKNKQIIIIVLIAHRKEVYNLVKNLSFN